MIFNIILAFYLLLLLICLVSFLVIYFHFKKLKVLPDIAAEKIAKVFLIGTTTIIIISLIFLILLKI